MLGNAQILKAIQPTARVKLEARLGGQSARIPQKVETLRRRVPELTASEAEQVIGVAGDAVVYFRRADAILARHSRVRVLAASGHSTAEIALEVDLSERRVRQILKEFA